MSETRRANPFAVSPDALTQPFWDAAKQGLLQMPRCEACSRFHFYPRPLCPFCGSHQLSWQPARPTGKLIAVTHVHRAPAPYFDTGAAYGLGIALLDDGPCFFAGIARQGAAVVGADVTVVFQPSDEEWPLPLFALR